LFRECCSCCSRLPSFSATATFVNGPGERLQGTMLHLLHLLQ